jgi:hypothetical protein
MASRGRAEALKDAALPASRTRFLGAEELLRIEIFRDDGGHRSRLDAARADGGARPGKCRLICRHEARRTRAGPAGARPDSASSLDARKSWSETGDRRKHVANILSQPSIRTFGDFRLAEATKPIDERALGVRLSRLEEIN